MEPAASADAGRARLAERGPITYFVRSEGKAFCARGELGMVDEMLASERVRQRVMREAREIVRGITDCDKPMVLAINGAAAGTGLAVALLADIPMA